MNGTVFVGRVIGDGSGQEFVRFPASLVVEEALRDSPQPESRVVVSTLPCQLHFRAGERYVVYASKGTQAGEYAMPACSPTFPVHGNERILEALRHQARGGPPRILGRVYEWPGRNSLAAASVLAIGPSGSLETASDGDGWYEYRSLLPGRYNITVSKPGFVPDEEFNKQTADGREAPVSGQIDLGARGCAIRYFAMWPDGRISGHVRGVDGRPVAGLTVEVFRVEGAYVHTDPAGSSPTGSGGHYEIRRLPRGEYAVGVNASSNADATPYPPTLRAQHVQLATSAAITGVDLVLPPKRIASSLSIQVLHPSGRAIPKAYVTLMDRDGRIRWYREDATDANGRVQIPVYVGEKYTLSIQAHSDNASLTRTLEVEGSPRPQTFTTQLE
ncbi:MAG: carboxypeptidase-like regulatory domain-containing protein [Bryobacteraceae bacterium]